MKKSEVKKYFDSLADNWDNELVHNDEIIGEILDYANVTQGVSVLDVACGTGVLFMDYLDRNVKSITGVDISQNMLKIAKEKFDDKRIKLICADIEGIEFDNSFDRCIIYNAFPHFPYPEKLIEKLNKSIVTGGRLCIAHSMSREALIKHHSGSAKNVSIDLIDEDSLAKIMSRYFKVDVKISDDRMYVVCGVKQNL